MTTKHPHQKLERHGMAFVGAILFVASLGGLFEIAPLFTIENTVENAPGVRVYTPLELAGRDIYVREGCYACHSQMIRTLRMDVERYGHYSLAAESRYDRPFQWGSKRTGPDLARIGGKYSDRWHVAHLMAPRAVVEGSIMPGYPFLAEAPLRLDRLGPRLATLARAGDPYTAEMIAAAREDALAQLDAEGGGDGLAARYGPRVAIRDFDGDPAIASEMDALVAYLQTLGALADLDAVAADKEILR